MVPQHMLSSGCTGAMQGVLRCLGRWFVTDGIHITLQGPGFPSRILNRADMILLQTFDVLAD